MDYLTNVSVVKGENLYIRDFVKIHRFLGVEKFLFFDREKDNLSEIFKGESAVEVVYFPEPNRHHYAWAEGVKHLQGKTVWAQFIDIDQVVVPVEHGNIKEFLQHYENLSGLALNWHSFGSGGHEVRPQVPINGPKTFYEVPYLAYNKRARGDRWVNNHIQSIVQVEHAQTRPWDTPHNCPMKPGSGMYNTSGAYTGGYTSSPPIHNVAYVAHYYTRSREEWEAKLKKGRADTGTVLHLDPHWAEGYKNDGINIVQDLFDVHNSFMNEVEDDTVAKIWNKIK